MPFVKTILLIDDDEIFNFVVESTLRMYDFADQIVACTSVEEGLSYLRKAVEKEHIDFPDIIFLDINMPVQNGWDFLDTYRQFPQELKKTSQLFLLSSSVDESDAIKSQQYEDVCDFICKPLTKDKLDFIKNRSGNK